MAKFTVTAVRRSGLCSCEMDVEIVEGTILPREMIAYMDRGSPFDHVIVAVLPQHRDRVVTLVCLNWVLPDNELVGQTLESVPMKSAERKRYMKYIDG